MRPVSKVRLPPAALEFLAPHSEWSKSWRDAVHLFLRHFYYWIRKNKIQIHELTASDVQRLVTDQSFGPGKRVINIGILRAYLIWLIENKKTSLNFHTVFPDYARWNPPPPSYAQRYRQLKVSTFRSGGSLQRLDTAMGRFHRWLRANEIKLNDVTREDLEKFLKDFFERTPFAKGTQHSFRSALRCYIDWLVDNGYMKDIDLSIIFPKGRKKSYRCLTPLAKQFLSTLPVSREPKTCFQYKAALCDFYEFLHDRKIREGHISRRHLEIWMNGLAVRKLKPGTRMQYLQRLRCHFIWMAEHGHLNKEPYDLIRIGDLPKRSKLLPRPLPPDVDLEIQRRLEKSEEIYDLALLLLRKTGIRIGELIRLPADCVKTEYNGNRSLKVPLGKMHSERLVPLTAETYLIIQKIQTKTREVAPDLDRLIPNRFQKQEVYHKLRDALQEVSNDLKTADPIMPHRLRHSFATELLNAGMSLYGLMRILGHSVKRLI